MIFSFVSVFSIGFEVEDRLRLMSVPELIGLIASVIAICELLYKVAVYLYQKKIFRWDILSHWQFKKINSSHGTFGHIVYLDGFAGPFLFKKNLKS